MTKLKTCALLIGVLFLTFALVGCGTGANDGPDMSDPVNRVVAALEDRRFSEAESLFSRYIDVTNMDALAARLTDRLVDLREEFTRGSIDHLAAMREAETIERFDIMDYVMMNEIISFINSLTASRTSFEMGETLFAAGRYLDAMANFELVIIDDPNYSTAQEGLWRARDAYRRAVLAAAADLAYHDNVPGAVDLLLAALDVMENDVEISRQLALYSAEVRGVHLEHVREMADSGNFAGAFGELSRMLVRYPEDVGVRVAFIEIEEGHVDAFIADINALMDRGHFQEAAVIAFEALWFYPANTRLNNALERALVNDVGGLLAMAEALAWDNQHHEAVMLLHNSVHAADPYIMARIRYLMQYLTWLEALNPSITGGNGDDWTLWLWNVQPRRIDRDNMGENHPSGVGFTISRDAWILAEYNLGGEYSLFEGAFTLNFDSRDSTAEYTLQIILDGEVAYTTDAITAGSQPIPLSVDVEDVDVIGFRVERAGGDLRASNVSIINGVLHRNMAFVAAQLPDELMMDELMMGDLTGHVAHVALAVPEFPGTLSRGSRGESVRLLQAHLNAIGNISAHNDIQRNLTVDGVFGPLTQGAVAAFQEHMGLEDDGVVDYDTWNRIMTTAANHSIVINLPPPPAPAANRPAAAHTGAASAQAAAGNAVPIRVITTNVSGANVYIDGVFMGRTTGRGATPLELHLAPGTRNLRITLSGYEDITAPIWVDPSLPRGPGGVGYRYEMRQVR